MEPSTNTSDGLFKGPSWEAYKNHLISKEALGGKISEHSLSHYNRLGYFGIYQMGVQALEDIGYIKPGTYKKMKRNDARQVDVLGDPENWTGGRNISWFSQEANQHEAIEKLTRKNYRTIAPALHSKGVETPGAVYGWLTAAHLGGAGSTKKYINTGKSNFKDANNTSLKKYRNSFADYYSKHIGEDTHRAAVVRGDQFTGKLPTVQDDGTTHRAVELILNNVDMMNSTLGNEDLKKVKARVASLIQDGSQGLNPDGGFIDKTVRLAYEKTDQTQLREILVPDITTVKDVEILSPESKEAPQEGMRYGGTLQPNGRKSTFDRPEDLKAQNKTTK